MLVNLTSRDTVSARYPVGWFNHAVLAVPARDGLSFPPAFEPAVVDAGDLGRLLIVDTTDEQISIGTLSAALAGKRALVVAGEKGRLVELPGLDAASHTIVRRIRVRPDGTAGTIERVSTYAGGFAWIARGRYGASALDRRRGLERRMMDIWPRATFEGIDVDRETPAGACVETIRLGCPSFACSAAPDRVDLFPGAADEVARVPLGVR